jgi:hypothetical protein
MQVTASADVSRVLSACVRQAFLPKFETEDKDTSIANCIVDQVRNGMCLFACPPCLYVLTQVFTS